MAWKAPVGHIVHNTSAGKTIGADLRRFNDEILDKNDISDPKLQRYSINAGKYQGKTICVNRFDDISF